MSSTIETPIDRLVAEVGAWEGVATAPHLAGTEFRLGGREIGHVHRGGLLDVSFPRRLRDALVAEGRTGRHRVVPGSGWTSYRVASEDDLPGARWLVRLSYVRALALARRRPGGRRLAAGVDPAAELDALAPSTAVRAAFEAPLAGPDGAAIPDAADGERTASG